LARFLYTIDWNVDTAELEVNQALELNPRNPQALHLASELASTRGQTDRALDFASKAIVNDPLGSRGFTRIAAAEIGKGNLVGAAAAA
jgi:tetratricopeptide (TPR) repeat protein